MLPPGLRLGVLDRVITCTDVRRVVDVKDFNNIADIAWAPDGRSLFATTVTLHGGDVLRVMLDGRAMLLRRFQSQNLLAPKPSLDGRSLLVGVQQSNSNVWVIER